MFIQSIAAWGQDSFAEILCRELKDSGLISLVDLMQQGSAPVQDSMHLSLLKVEELEGQIRAKVSVFFDSIIAGCQCADDPNPVDPIHEYAEVTLLIDCEDGSGSIYVE